MKITKKQLTYLVESEVKKQLKLRGNKNARRHTLRINEGVNNNDDNIAAELVNILNPVFEYAVSEDPNEYIFTIDDNVEDNLLNCVDLNTDLLDIDEVEQIIEGAKELTISFYIGDYQYENYVKFKNAINKLMSEYPMYTGYVDDANVSNDIPEIYYKIRVPLNDLSSLPSLLDDIITNRDF